MSTIRDMRQKLGMTQQNLADRIQVSQGAVWQWENGRTKPSVENLVAIARALGCTVDDLLVEE